MRRRGCWCERGEGAGVVFVGAGGTRQPRVETRGRHQSSDGRGARDKPRGRRGALTGSRDVALVTSRARSSAGEAATRSSRGFSSAWTLARTLMAASGFDPRPPQGTHGFHIDGLWGGGRTARPGTGTGTPTRPRTIRRGRERSRGRRPIARSAPNTRPEPKARTDAGRADQHLLGRKKAPQGPQPQRAAKVTRAGQPPGDGKVRPLMASTRQSGAAGWAGSGWEAPAAMTWPSVPT